jgi:hypothetical protein
LKRNHPQRNGPKWCVPNDEIEPIHWGNLS